MASRSLRKTSTDKRVVTLSHGDPDARSRLLDAATLLIKEKGPNGTSVRAICSLAGVHPPILYHHFGDLNGLYSAVMEAVCAAYAPGHSEFSQPLARIDDVWNRVLLVARHEPEIINLMNRQLGTGQVPEQLRQNYEQLATAFEQLAKTTRLRVTPRIAAHVYWAGAQGLAILIVASHHGIAFPDGAEDVTKKALLESIFETLPVGILTPEVSPEG